MGYFGIGMANGVLNGFQAGHQMKMDELRHQRLPEQDQRRQELVDLQKQKAEMALSQQQRQQDFQDAQMI